MFGVFRKPPNLTIYHIENLHQHMLLLARELGVRASEAVYHDPYVSRNTLAVAEAIRHNLEANRDVFDWRLLVRRVSGRCATLSYGLTQKFIEVHLPPDFSRKSRQEAAVELERLGRDAFYGQSSTPVDWRSRPPVEFARTSFALMREAGRVQPGCVPAIRFTERSAGASIESVIAFFKETRHANTGIDFTR